jgi:hypothetical protein
MDNRYTISHNRGTQLSCHCISVAVNLISVIKVEDVFHGIDGIVHDKTIRSDFVQGILQRAKLFIAGSTKFNGYNALVVDDNHDYRQHFKTIAAELKFDYPGELL